MYVVVTISQHFTIGAVLLCCFAPCLGESTLSEDEYKLVGSTAKENLKIGEGELAQNEVSGTQIASGELIPKDSFFLERQRRAMKGCCKMCHKQKVGENVTIANDTGTMNTTKSRKKGCCGMCKMMMMMNAMMKTNSTGAGIGSNSSEMSGKKMKMKCCSMCGMPMKMSASGNDIDDNINGTSSSMCAMCSMRMSANKTAVNKTDADKSEGTPVGETQKKKTKHGCPMCRMMMKKKKKMCPMCMKHKMGEMSQSTVTMETTVTATDKPLHFVKVLVNDGDSQAGILVPALLGALGVLVIIFVACFLKRRRRKLRRSRPAAKAMYSPVHGEELKVVVEDA